MIPRAILISAAICVITALLLYFILSRLFILFHLSFIVENIIASIVAILYDVACILTVPEVVVNSMDVPDADIDRVRRFVARLATALAICIIVFSTSV